MLSQLFSAHFLVGCASRGMSLASALPDKSTITGSIGRTQRDPGQASDAATVRNAVSALDMSRADGGTPWSNPATGSSGVISSVVETTGGTGLCRSFDASRVSYDGVRLFHGQACMDAAGAWALVAFQPEQG